MNIEVMIERLVLDGISLAPAQRPILQMAVETELARLLSEGGLSPILSGGGAMPSLSTGEIHLGLGRPAGGLDPAHLGRQIAGAVYGGIGGQETSTNPAEA